MAEKYNNYTKRDLDNPYTYSKLTKFSKVENNSSSSVSEGNGIGSVIASHYNNVEERGVEFRDKSRIVYMRNFNNWIKTVLIMRYLSKIKNDKIDDYSVKILDLGCGKGGDILKWQKAAVRHVTFADIAATSVSQCQDRYENFKRRGGMFSSQFMVADCTKCDLKKYSKVPFGSYDIVSSQFSFHYSFESLSQAETMVRNISEALRVNGYFIATCPDANKIVSSLEKGGGRSFGNEVFRIEFPPDRGSSPPLFGDKYNFFLEGVVDCPEFLVHFPTLVTICKKYNLELDWRKPFEEVYTYGYQDREMRSLLFRMRALEVFSSESADRSSEPPGSLEFDHAKRHLAQYNETSVKTLSKSEWEAICLYVCFAFKKVR